MSVLCHIIIQNVMLIRQLPDQHPKFLENKPLERQTLK